MSALNRRIVVALLPGAKHFLGVDPQTPSARKYIVQTSLNIGAYMFFRLYGRNPFVPSVRWGISSESGNAPEHLIHFHPFKRKKRIPLPKLNNLTTCTVLVPLSIRQIRSSFVVGIICFVFSNGRNGKIMSFG